MKRLFGIYKVHRATYVKSYHVLGQSGLLKEEVECPIQAWLNYYNKKIKETHFSSIYQTTTI